MYKVANKTPHCFQRGVFPDHAANRESEFITKKCGLQGPNPLGPIRLGYQL